MRVESPDPESLESNYTANAFTGREVNNFSVPLFSEAKDGGQVHGPSTNLQEESKRRVLFLSLFSFLLFRRKRFPAWPGDTESSNNRVFVPRP